MWVFTDTGFLSMVRDGEVPNHLLVRARVRADLEQFVELCQDFYRCPIPGGIRESTNTDYRFRASVPAAAAGGILGMLASGIHYQNFKNRVHDVDPDPARHRAYIEVWTAMERLQRIHLMRKRPSIPVAAPTQEDWKDWDDRSDNKLLEAAERANQHIPTLDELFDRADFNDDAAEHRAVLQKARDVVSKRQKKICKQKRKGKRK